MSAEDYTLFETGMSPEKIIIARDPLRYYKTCRELMNRDIPGVTIDFDRHMLQLGVTEMLRQRSPNCRIAIAPLDKQDSLGEATVIDTAVVMYRNWLEFEDFPTFEGDENLNQKMVQLLVDHAIKFLGKDPWDFNKATINMEDIREKRPLTVTFAHTATGVYPTIILEDTEQNKIFSTGDGVTDSQVNLNAGDELTFTLEFEDFDHESGFEVERRFRVQVTLEEEGGERMEGVDARLAKLLCGGLGLDEEMDINSLGPLRRVEVNSEDVF